MKLGHHLLIVFFLFISGEIDHLLIKLELILELIWISHDFADISILTPNKLTYCDSIERGEGEREGKGVRSVRAGGLYSLKYWKQHCANKLICRFHDWSKREIFFHRKKREYVFLWLSHKTLYKDPG